jgi:hypothetical protein
MRNCQLFEKDSVSWSWSFNLRKSLAEGVEVITNCTMIKR